MSWSTGTTHVKAMAGCYIELKPDSRLGWIEDNTVQVALALYNMLCSAFAALVWTVLHSTQLLAEHV